MNPAFYHANLKKKDNSVPRFTLEGTERYAKVVSVHDGDTCDLLFYQDEQQMNQDKPVRYNCRMLSYNAPELKEKPRGKLARGYLTYLCTGGDAHTYNPEVENLRTEKRVQRKLNDNEDSLVYAVFGGAGKYGRQLVTLYQTLKEEDDSTSLTSSEDDSTSVSSLTSSEDDSMTSLTSSEDDVPPKYENTSINSMMAQYINTLP